MRVTLLLLIFTLILTAYIQTTIVSGCLSLQVSVPDELLTNVSTKRTKKTSTTTSQARKRLLDEDNLQKFDSILKKIISKQTDEVNKE